MSTPRNPELPILLVDDEPLWLRGMTLALERSLGLDHTLTCSDSRQAMNLLEQTPCSLALLDVTMPHISGEELLAQIREAHPELPVIMLTGRNQVEIAVRCMKHGAFDYFIKTADEERIMGGIRRALEFSALRRENQSLRAALCDRSDLQHPDAFSDLVSNSPRLRNLFRYVEAVAPSPEPVLIVGETGTGKELVARAVQRCARPDAPWVAVNVAGLDDTVFADTLFGHSRGAFTGAQEARAGMIESAAGGVLFLDEIGDLSLASQVKLLRLIQEGEYYPLGSDVPRKHSARLVFATHCDLTALEREGCFRRDLLYRLQTHRIDLPPLRERIEDLPLLLEHFLNEAAKALDKKLPGYPPELLTLLKSHTFPGNVRELRSMVFDALSRHQSGTLALAAFQQAIGNTRQAPVVLSAGNMAGTAQGRWFSGLSRIPTIDEAVDELVRESMRLTDGNQTQASRLLGISRPALHKRLKKFDE